MRGIDRKSVKSRKILVRQDIAAIAVIVLLIIAAVIAGSGGRPDYVSVRMNGELYYRASLGEDKVVDVDGKLKVVISGGKVSVRDAVCPDKLCEYSALMDKSGQKIICLPCKIVVSMDGKGDYEVIT